MVRKAQTSLIAISTHRSGADCSIMCAWHGRLRLSTGRMTSDMNKRTWFAGWLVSTLLAGCSGVLAPTGQIGDRQTASPAASAAGATAPVPMGTAYAREKLEQAEAAMRNKDDLQAQYLLEQAEAAAWLVEARERSRLLLEINARRADLAGKRAREAIAQSESAQQAPRAAADQLETKPPTPEAKPTPPDMVVTLGDLLFNVGSATLHAEAAPTIDRLAEFLRKHPQRKVSIEGYTDSTGSDKRNLSLSERRANAVRQALVKRGVVVERIRVRGYGPAYPVASNGNKAGRQQNRRVEVIISDAEGRIPDRRAISSK